MPPTAPRALKTKQWPSADPPARPAARRSYGGRSAAELQAERRQRLLDAGLILFSERGYARTPIDVLCTAAKVTPRHFYESFSTREAVLAEIYEQIVGEARAATAAALQDRSGDVGQQARRGIGAFVGSYLEDPRKTRLCVLEVVGVSAPLEKRRREVIHEFAGIIRAYADYRAGTGELPLRDYHLMSVALVGAVNELLAEWLTAPRPPGKPALVAEIEWLFAALLGQLAPIRKPPT